MTSKEYRDRIERIIAQLVFALQDDKAAGMLMELRRRVENEGIDEELYAPIGGRSEHIL